MRKFKGKCASGFKTKTAEMFVPYIPQFVEFPTSIIRQDKLTQVTKTKSNSRTYWKNCNDWMAKKKF